MFLQQKMIFVFFYLWHLPVRNNVTVKEVVMELPNMQYKPVRRVGTLYVNDVVEIQTIVLTAIVEIKEMKMEMLW